MPSVQVMLRLKVTCNARFVFLSSNRRYISFTYIDFLPHVRSNLCYVICVKGIYFNREQSVANQILFSKNLDLAQGWSTLLTNDRPKRKDYSAVHSGDWWVNEINNSPIGQFVNYLCADRPYHD